MLDLQTITMASFLIVGSEATALQAETNTASLVAGIAVERSLHLSSTSEPLNVELTLVNDGQTPVTTSISTVKLMINGQLLADSEWLLGNRARNSCMWETLQPHQATRLAWDLSSYFQTAGMYRVSWKADNFQTPEASIRVLAKEYQFDGCEGSTSKIIQKLNEIRLPEVKLSGKNVSDLVAFLNEESVRVDRHNQGVKIVIQADDLALSQQPEKSWTNIPLIVAIRRIAETAGLRVHIEDDKVVISNR